MIRIKKGDSGLFREVNAIMLRKYTTKEEGGPCQPFLLSKYGLITCTEKQGAYVLLRYSLGSELGHNELSHVGWVYYLPWGRRLTLTSGITQIDREHNIM